MNWPATNQISKIYDAELLAWQEGLWRDLPGFHRYLMGQFERPGDRSCVVGTLVSCAVAWMRIASYCLRNGQWHCS